ncbi:hypothetical protein [Pseudomonas sp. NPDC089569]|uniref:hypothetical protein n=1 Tax=Pseudomonas sp. NPDC089569 TaxID=3390722 RepID=UPI003CFD4927
MKIWQSSAQSFSREMMACFDLRMSKAGWPRLVIPTQANAALADKFDVSVGYVAAQRKQLNIKAMNPVPRRTWTAQDVALLGSSFDSKVSLLSGIPTTADQFKRSELSIQSFASTL